MTDTLFYPHIHNLLDNLSAQKGVFLNAQNHECLSDFPALVLQQHFKPYANELQEQGFRVSSLIPQQEAAYDFAFMLMPKNTIEAEYFLANASKLLKQDAMIIVAGDNKAGGGRIKKMLQHFGFDHIQIESKNKARVGWAQKKNTDAQALEKAIAAGGPQAIAGEQYISQPGVFGWNKIDRGSEILLQHIEGDFSGNGADFGCGYGYLSKEILLQHKDVGSLVCIDADFRAIKLCQSNIESLGPLQTIVRYFWEDLEKPVSNLTDLDWIIMNPPFHEGKITDSDIGKNFILSAQQSLRFGGKLWCVANAHLPYESVFSQSFSSHKIIYEGQGFKVFCATK